MKRLGFLTNPSGWDILPGVVIDMTGTRRVLTESGFKNALKRGRQAGDFRWSSSLILNPRTLRLIQNTAENRARIQGQVIRKTIRIDFDEPQVSQIIAGIHQALEEVRGSPPRIRVEVKAYQIGRADLGEWDGYVGGDKSASRLFEEIKRNVLPDSDALALVEEVDITIRVPMEIRARRVNQRFATGKFYHCLVSKIREDTEKTIEETTSESYKVKLNTRLNHLRRWEEKFIDSNGEAIGMCDKDIQELCDETGISIKLLCNLGRKVIQEFTPKDKRGVARYTFANTELNHLNLLRSKSTIPVHTQMEMKALREGAWAVSEHQIENYKDGKRVYEHRIYSVINENGVHQYVDENDPIQKQLCEWGVSPITIKEPTEVKNPLMLPYGTHFVNVVNFNPVVDGMIMYDMKKAYTQYKKSPYYIGFPTRMVLECQADFTMEFVRNHPGYYRATFGEHNNQLWTRLGMTGVLMLPSFVLMMFEDYGVPFTIDYGCIGDCEDLELAEYMFKPYEYDGRELRKPYANLVGKMGMISKNSSHIYKIQLQNFEFLANLKAMYPNSDIVKRGDYFEFNVHKTCKTYTHLAGFFTMYCFTHIFELMMKIPYENLGMMNLDSLTFMPFEGMPEADGVWVDKTPEIKKLNNMSNRLFTNTCPDWNYYDKLDLETIDKLCGKRQLVLGQGGCGKSTEYLSGGKYQFYDLLATALMYRTIREMKSSFDVNTITIGRIHEWGGRPHTIFIDEATMIDDKDFVKVEKMFPKSTIIVAGDFNLETGKSYQCDMTGVAGFTPLDLKRFSCVRTFTTDYRAKDEKLRLWKKQSREGKFVPEKIETLETLKKEYVDSTDIILTFTNKHIENLSAIIPSSKAVIKGRTSGEYLTGDIVSRNVAGSVPQSAFTCHSIQGITWKNGTIWINVADGILRSKKLLYTAISRACYSRQVRFFSSL